MRQYFKYLNYVLRHKWYVMIECFKMKLIWRGIVHDLSKFLPSEYIPYANHFYDKEGNKKQARGKTGYYKPTDTGDKDFDFAWLLHQKRNKHHWQWWILPEDDGGMKILDIPEVFIKEMVCDWVGAGKAQGFYSPKDDKYYETRTWYDKNYDKMQLSISTRHRIQEIIGYRK